MTRETWHFSLGAERTCSFCTWIEGWASEACVVGWLWGNETFSYAGGQFPLSLQTFEYFPLCLVLVLPFAFNWLRGASTCAPASVWAATCKMEILERVSVNTRPMPSQKYRAQETTDQLLSEQPSCHRLGNKTHNNLDTSWGQNHTSMGLIVTPIFICSSECDPCLEIGSLPVSWGSSHTGSQTLLDNLSQLNWKDFDIHHAFC